MSYISAAAASAVGFVLILILPGETQGFSYANETRLRDDLAAGYDAKVRPSSLVNIQLSLELTGINAVSMKGQYLSLSGWWSMRWIDHRLRWQPDHYDMEYMHFDMEEVWFPSLVVSNSQLDLSAIDEDTIPMRVNYQGEFTWQPPSILQVVCDTNPTYFPFDTQRCNLEVTSFGYGAEEVTISSDSGIMTNFYTINGEWDLVGTETFASNITDQKGIEYSRLTYTLTLRRKADFCLLNVISPLQLIGVLIMFVFMLPAGSGEKVSFALTLLLAYALLMSLISADMPSTSTHTSLLEVYIVLVLSMGALSVILAIVNVNMSHTADSVRPPEWMCKLTLLFTGSRECCANRDSRKVCDLNTTMEIFNTDKHKNTEHLDDNIKSIVLTSDGSGEKKIAFAADKPETEVTWRLVATVMDAVCLRVYAVTFTVLTIVFMTALAYGDS